MARIRTIKPEFFTSLTIADLTPEQRLTFIGLWTHVDDAGRCVDDPRLIKAAVWPLDDRTAADVENDIAALTESSLIVRYILNRKRYLAVRSWDEHQRINRPTPSKLPAPDQGEPVPPSPVTREDVDSHTPHGVVTEPSPLEGKGREGKGREGKTPAALVSSEIVAVADAPERDLPSRMFDEWWNRYGRTTAQSKRTIRQAIRDALDNGIDARELWQALERLAAASKPVTGNTLQMVLADVRRDAAASNVVPLQAGLRATGTDANTAAHMQLIRELEEEGM